MAPVDAMTGRRYKVGSMRGVPTGKALRAWLGALALGGSLGMMAEASAMDTPPPPPADADPSCPSQDFTQFLRYFTDLADDRVRSRYTTDPLEYEMPVHGAASDGGPAANEVLREAGPARLRRLRGATLRATPAITPLPEGGQQVRLGDDAQAEHYTFVRRYGCWMLTRVARPQG